MRARAAAAFSVWFRPERWSGHDAVAAIAAFALAVTVFLPWFHATIGIRGSAVTGFLIDPPGELTGIAAHRYLWLAFALALLQCLILVARNAPGRRALNVPYHRQIQLALSAITFVIVLIACIMKPPPWYGSLQFPENFYLVINWTFGAIAALGAGIISIAIWIVAIRDQPRIRPPW